MKLRAEWGPYLHAVRTSEINLVFARCPEKLFASGLELGAGDGFQSRLLENYVCTLTSTDYSSAILKNRNTESVKYRVCDAEELEEEFTGDQFDLIYSSNLLEHLPDPQKALRGMSKVLTQDGIAVHVVPSPFWKLCHVLLHLPNMAAGFVEAAGGQGGMQNVLAKIKSFHGNYPSKCASSDQQPPPGNNPKISRAPRSALYRLFVPEPHGVSHKNIQEFYAFSRTRWLQEFAAASFEVLRVVKGPVTSGYGFGLDFLRHGLEIFGVTSEYIYITAKEGSSTAFSRYF